MGTFDHEPFALAYGLKVLVHGDCIFIFDVVEVPHPRAIRGLRSDTSDLDDPLESRCLGISALR